MKFLWLVVLVAQAALCCEVGNITLQRVESDFTVVVAHHKKPIAGIRVEVQPYGKSDSIFVGTTDEHGSLRVANLAVGQYFVSASHQGFDAGKQWIEVVAVPDQKAKTRIDFRWADSSYETRHAAGTLTGLVPGDTGKPLTDIIHPKKTVYPGVAISLRNAFALEEYRTFSDSSGGFVFDNIPDGIYVMTIEGGMTSVNGTGAQTRLVIDVAADSARDALPLSLQPTGCGSVEFALREN